MIHKAYTLFILRRVERLLGVVTEDLDYMRTPLLLALGTGLRRGELLSLKIDCVNVSARVNGLALIRLNVGILPSLQWTAAVKMGGILRAGLR